MMVYDPWQWGNAFNLSPGSEVMHLLGLDIFDTLVVWNINFFINMIDMYLFGVHFLYIYQLLTHNNDFD